MKGRKTNTTKRRRMKGNLTESWKRRARFGVRLKAEIASNEKRGGGAVQIILLDGEKGGTSRPRKKSRSSLKKGEKKFHQGKEAPVAISEKGEKKKGKQRGPCLLNKSDGAKRRAGKKGLSAMGGRVAHQRGAEGGEEKFRRGGRGNRFVDNSGGSRIEKGRGVPEPPTSSYREKRLGLEGLPEGGEKDRNSITRNFDPPAREGGWDGASRAGASLRKQKKESDHRSGKRGKKKRAIEFGG